MARKPTSTRTRRSAAVAQDSGNVVSMQGAIADSFTNLLMGLGGPLDKVRAQRYGFTNLVPAQLEQAYRGDWIARKVIDIPADDATRMWRAWKSEGKDIERIEELERELGVQQRLCEALKSARLYGGSIIVLGVGTDAPEKPLDVETVKKDSLKYLHVLNRHEIATGPIDRNVLSPTFGNPEYYDVNAEGLRTRLHPTRVIRLLGRTYPGAVTREAWSDSVLDAVDDAIKSSGLVTQGVAQLVADTKLDIIKVPGLSRNIMTQEYRDKLTQRFDFANARKSMLNALILDGEEDWQRITTSFASLPDILKMYLLIVCGAVDIPATRFLGQSAVGLNATGEGDVRNYYDSVKSFQEIQLTPAINVLDEVLIRSALGTRDPKIWYEWNSLWQLDEAQKLELAERKAKVAQLDAVTGLVPEQALAKGRQNQLVDDGLYPGFEEILEEVEEEAEAAAKLEEQFSKLDEWFGGKTGFDEEESDEDVATDAGKFEESEHPRNPQGSEGGGRFAPKGGSKKESKGKRKPAAEKESKSEGAKETDVKSPDLGAAFDLNKVPVDSEGWSKTAIFHGSKAEIKDFSNDREVYLTGVRSEASAFAEGVHLGGTEGSSAYVYEVEFRPGKVANVDNVLLKAMEDGDDLAEVLDNYIANLKYKESDVHRTKKIRYIEFTHPPSASGTEDFKAVVSLYPSDDLRIARKNKAGDAFPEFEEEEHPRYPQGDPRGGQFAPKGGSEESAKADISRKLSVAHLKVAEKLRNVGFNVIHADSLPSEVRKHTNYKGTGEVTKYHAIAGEAFANAMQDVRGTRLADLLDPDFVSQIKIAYANYEPLDATMTTVTGQGEAIFLINTANDYEKIYTKHSKEKSFKENTSYAHKRGLEELERSSDFEAAVREESRVAVVHEMAHMLDAASGRQLRETFLQALDLEGLLDDESQKTLHDWLRKNISAYANTSPDEAMAEAVSKYIFEGKLPGDFVNRWAEALIGKRKA